MMQLEQQNENLRDDAVLGEALVRARVIGTGHLEQPIETYLQRYASKPPSLRPYHTTARGLREFFRYAGCLVEDADTQKAWITPLGAQLAANANDPHSLSALMAWRVAIASIRIGNSQRGYSHPYRVLLRLVEARPGISSKMSPLAFEANDDSDSELVRIAQLSDLQSEDAVRDAIGGETQANWDNAKKVLPGIAEQLGDLERLHGILVLRNSEMQLRESINDSQTLLPDIPDEEYRFERQTGTLGRRGRQVSASSIARAGLTPRSVVADLNSFQVDPVTAAAAITIRAIRLTRHNEMVRSLARLLQDKGAQLWEDPFDCLAMINGRAAMFEVKTLDGTAADEMKRVRDALAQILYYRSFNLPQAIPTPRLTVVFGARPSEDHAGWLLQSGIYAAWMNEDQIVFSRPAFDIDTMFAVDI